MTNFFDLFPMDDISMNDSSYQASPQCQPPYAPENAYSDPSFITVQNGHDLTNNLFPFLENLSTLTTTAYDSTTTDMPLSLENWQEGDYSLYPINLDTNHYLFGQGQDAAFPYNAQGQSIPKTMGTPDMYSEYTNSYSSSHYAFTAIERDFELNAMSFSQQNQEDLGASFFQAPSQGLSVSPLSNFDMMNSPANSCYAFMEEFSCHSATSPVQSPLSLSNNTIHTSAIMIASGNTMPINKTRYDCLECDRDFGRLQDLNRHFQSRHSDEKRFRCTCCDRGFSRKDALKRHENTKKKVDRPKKRSQQSDHPSCRTDE